MVYVKLLSVLAIIGATAWLVAEPGYESGLALIGATSALVSILLAEKRRTKRARQQQSVSGSSLGIQAGRDVHIGSRQSPEQGD